MVSNRECWGLRDCFCCFKMGDFIFILFYFLIFGCVESSLLARAFSSCGERGLLFVAVRGLLIAVASLVAEHGL